jgi:hypothetical protein
LQGQAEPEPEPSSPLGSLSPETGILWKDDFVIGLIQTSSGDQAFMEDFTLHLRDQGESELRVFSIPDTPAFYADGKRSILEISDSFTSEYGAISIEMLELYFRALEKAGVMQILKK